MSFVNSQGGHCFPSLSTGHRIDTQHFTELPMPNDVTDRVHQLARRAKADRGMTFGWRDGTEIEDDEDDVIADPDCNPDDDDNNDWDAEDDVDCTAGSESDSDTDEQIDK